MLEGSKDRDMERKKGERERGDGGDEGAARSAQPALHTIATMRRQLEPMGVSRVRHFHITGPERKTGSSRGAQLRSN